MSASQGEPVPSEAPGGEGPGAPAEAAVRKRARSTRDRKPPPPRPGRAALARLGLRLAGSIPPRAAFALGTAAGGLLARLPTREARVTRVNLALCFPELAPREREDLARRSLQQTARTALELGALWTGPLERVAALVVEVHGEEHLRAALAPGRGAILAAPHLGAWELCGLHLAARYPFTALYRPPRVRELEGFYKQARERTGSRLVPAGASGVRALTRALAAGEIAGILPDQDPGRGEGIFVPYFGVRANTSVLLPRIAARSGAGVVLAYCERLGPGRFALRIEPVDASVADADLARAAAAMNRAVEHAVRSCPQQYLWSYKRFRVRPGGETDPYKTRG